MGDANLPAVCSPKQQQQTYVCEAPNFVRDDLYEERETAGAGIAVFATGFIPSGTRLFCERSLIVAPEEAEQLELFQIVNSLPAEEKEAYWKLAASSKPRKDVAWINELRQSCQGEDESFNALVEVHERAWSIYETNRFNLKFPNGDHKLGVFARAARLNHSCAPNVFHRYNPRINRLTIHALRDIQPGEELNTSYIDICDSKVMRQHILRDWGFTCGCSACSSCDEEEDVLRRRIEDVMSKVKIREERRCGEAALDDDEEAEWEEKDYAKSMKMIERGIRLMEKAGMEETDTLGYLLSMAAQYGLRLRRQKEAAVWAARLIDVERKCLGEDSNEYQAAVDLLRTINESS